jgi:hypothetical protein
MGRKHISDKTRLAATLLARGEIPYADAKNMSEDQLISLYHWDHNILHESEHEDRDKFWNLAPMLIKAHREKTRLDAKIIAKSRRIRAWNEKSYRLTALGLKLKRKLKSRGFDKRYRKKMDGTVVRRAGD